MASRSNAIEDEDIWGDDENISHQDWAKMDEEYTNAGYREGITAGKEAALQEGFDDGFASVGVPLGRTVGKLRGVANALKNFLSTKDTSRQQYGAEIIKIVEKLGEISLADLAPPDVEAEAHAGEHAEEALEDLSRRAHERPAVKEIKHLKERLSIILKEIGIDQPEPLFS